MGRSITGLMVLVLGVGSSGCATLRDHSDCLVPDPRQSRHEVDFKHLHGLAVRAQRVYDHPDLLRDELEQHGVDVFVVQLITLPPPLPALDLTCTLEWLDERQVLAVEGTEGMLDFIVDVICDLERDPTTRLEFHEGFLQTARFSRHQIEGRLQKDAPVEITGHSLGGAIALIVGWWLAQDGYDVRVITVGQPKVMNLATALARDEFLKDGLQVIRVVNDLDPIPALPPYRPSSFSFERLYSHAGPEVILMGDDVWSYREPHMVHHGWMFLTELVGTIESSSTMVSTGFDQHGIELYVNRLERLSRSQREVAFHGRREHMTVGPAAQPDD